MPPTPVPEQIRAALDAGRKVTCGPVTLRPPTDPDGRGAVCTFRVEWRCPVSGERRQRTRRRLEDAWLLALAEADRLQVSAPNPRVPAVPRRVSGPSRTLGAAVEAYLDPALHTGWSENRRKTVTSLLRNWVAAPDIRVVVDGHHIVAAELPLDRLTPGIAEQILVHVHGQRAHRTYTDVHRELRTLLRWAGRERLLPHAQDLVERIDLARPERPDPSGATNRLIGPVDPSEIPGLEAIDALRRIAHAHEGLRGALFVDVLAFGGLRIGEALGLATDPQSLPFDEQEDSYRPYVWQRAHRTLRETRPPKHHRNRHAWLPPWMTGQLDDVLALGGPWLFPAPRGGLWSTDAFRTRRFDRWLQQAGWPRLPESDERQRVWQWTAHSLRHHAASWMLNELTLPPDDVAEFLGHGDGHQVWVMYSRVQSGLAARASRKAREAGDPRGLGAA